MVAAVVQLAVALRQPLRRPLGAATEAVAAAVPPNILLASLDYTDVAWTKSRLSVQANAAAAPGGAQTADKLVEDTTSGNHEVKQTFTKPAGVTQLFTSIAAKAAGRTQAYLNLDDNSSTNRAYIRLDLTTGAKLTSVVGTVGIVAHGADPLGDDWWRLWMVCSAPAEAGIYAIRPRVYAGAASYLGDGTSGILLARAQVHVSSRLLPYAY